MNGVVSVTGGTSLVRCAVQHLPSFFESEKRLCNIADTEAMSFQDLVRRLPHSTYLDLTTQTGAPDNALEKEITCWDPRSTRDPSSGSSFWPQQPDATSRLGPDLVPPRRSGDEMSAQGPDTTHVPFPHPSASERDPPDVPVASVEPEKSVQPMSTRRITFKRPPNPSDRAELRNVPKLTVMSVLHFSLFTIVIWRRSPGSLTMEKVCSVEQRCLTCRTVLGLRSKPRHRKVNQRWMRILLSLRKRMSPLRWSRSLSSKKYNKHASIPIQRQLSM